MRQRGDLGAEEVPGGEARCLQGTEFWGDGPVESMGMLHAEWSEGVCFHQIAAVSPL